MKLLDEISSRSSVGRSQSGSSAPSNEIVRQFRSQYMALRVLVMVICWAIFPVLIWKWTADPLTSYITAANLGTINLLCTI